MFVRAGQSGIRGQFFLYTRKDTIQNEACSSENVVLRLSTGKPHHLRFKLSFGSLFCTLSLMLKPKEKGILTTATIRANWLAGCHL